MRFVGLILLTVFMLATSPARADEPERIIGILAIPPVFSYTAEVTETPSINILAEPVASAAVIATASSEAVTSPQADDLYLAEVAYEENGFEVVEQRDGWYRVVLRHAKGGTWLTGWVLPPADHDYTQITEYLQKQILEFTPGWDRTLFVSPASTELAPPPKLDAEGAPVIGVDISTATYFNGNFWLRVHLRHNCTEEEPDQYGGGWVKLPNDWRTLFNHYSRGC